MTFPSPTTDFLSKPVNNGKKNVLIVGCGYLGRQVALAARHDQCQVWATTRRPRRALELANLGILPLIVDWNDRRTLDRLPDADQILVAVSYDRNSPHDRYHAQVDGLRNLLLAVSPRANVCYISTTGVYHQTDARWVDEASPTRPSRAGGTAHLCAEQLLHQLRPESPSTILRLAGIYGPGRVPRAADVIAGRVIHAPRDGYLNLIHVDDATRAVLSTWRNPGQRLYVVSDDQPVVRGDFYREIARQCRAPNPRFAPPAADAPVAMRSESNKRIWNRRFKRDLVSKLIYPTYREGLRQILATGYTAPNR